jgi:hypothetical protein
LIYFESIRKEGEVIVKFLKKGAQLVKEVFHKFLIIGKGHSNFILKNNTRALLELFEFRRCQK